MTDKIDEWNRKVRTLYTWSHLYLGFKVAQVRSRMLPEQKRAAYWKSTHSRFAQAIWSNIADLRGWWVKVGQFLSTRADLLPDEYVAELTKVQDMMPTSAFALVKETVEGELGARLDEVFEFFEETALASASIGQVHRARLLDGTEVVVKVQHPNVDKLLGQDMALLGQLSWAFGLLESGLSFTSVLEEWQKQAALELDFTFEARSQARVREAMIRANIDVRIPKTYPELTTKRVLVMEYVDGFKCTDREMLTRYKVDVDWLCTEITRSFAYQIHIDGMFNGDPHPGNIMVEIDAETGKPRPVLIDWGLVKEFDDKERLAFSRTITSVANVDVMGLMEAFQDMGFTFKRPQTKSKGRKGVVEEASPIPVDPELYMDAISIMLTNKNDGKDIKVAITEKDKEQMWSKVKEGNSKKKLDTIQDQNPLDDWPKDIIFFLRVASLLHGLSVQLKAKVPFFQILLERAEQAIYQAGETSHPNAHLVYLGRPAKALGLRPAQSFVRDSPRSALEWRLHQLLCVLSARGEIVGCQVSVWHRRRNVADVAVGRMGPCDGRPVTTQSLFTAYSLCNVLLVTMILNLISSQKLKLSDCVSEWWDGFIGGDKRHVTVEQILTHQSGIHSWLPSNLTLTQITNYKHMIRTVEAATPVCLPGKCGHYPFYCVSWIYNELIANVSKSRSTSKYFRTTCLKEWNLKRLQKSIYFPVPPRIIVEAKQTPTTDHPLRAGTLLQASAPLDETTATIEPPLDATPQPSRKGPRKISGHTDSDDDEEDDNKTDMVWTPDPMSASPAHSPGESISPRPSKETRTKSPPFSSPPKSKPRQNTGRHTNRPHRSTPGHFEICLQDSEIAEDVETTATIDLIPQALLNKVDKDEPIPLKLRSAISATTDFYQRFQQSSSIPMKSVSERLLLSVTNIDGKAKEEKVDDIAQARDVLNRLTQARRNLGLAKMVDAQSMKLSTESLVEVVEDRRAPEIIACEASKKKWMDDFVYRKSGQKIPPRLSKYSSRVPKMEIYLKEKSLEESRFAKLMAMQKEEAVGLSALELMRSRPHLLDPLLFDSINVCGLDIPCANGRMSARALSMLLHSVSRGAIIRNSVLKAACRLHTYDRSLEAVVATGGLPPMFGLGYQLLPVKLKAVHTSAKETIVTSISTDLLPSDDLKLPHLKWRSPAVKATVGPFATTPNTRVHMVSPLLSEQPTDARRPLSPTGRKSLLRFNSTLDPSLGPIGCEKESRAGFGFGGSDMGGNLCFSFPEEQLTVCVMVNDVVNGSMVSNRVLNLVLEAYGLSVDADSI